MFPFDCTINSYYGPYSCCYHYLELRVSPDNVIEFNGKDSINIDGINLTAFLTFHLKDSISFYMSVNDINMCFLSDAAYSTALVKEVIRDYHKYQPIDILIIAANGKSGNLDTKNCLSLTDKIRPKILIPMHYGMFKETHSDPKIVTRAVKESYPDVQTVIIGFKESYIYSKF